MADRIKRIFGRQGTEKTEPDYSKLQETQTYLLKQLADKEVESNAYRARFGIQEQRAKKLSEELAELKKDMSAVSEAAYRRIERVLGLCDKYKTLTDTQNRLTSDILTSWENENSATMTSVREARATLKQIEKNLQ